MSTAARCRCRRRRRRWRRVWKKPDRKQALARRAASVVKPGQFVFLDSGSTNLALVSCLPEDFELTIATNSIDIAAAALRRSDLRLIMVGGAVNYGVGGCVDAPATLSLMQMNIDLGVLGACAVSFATGLGATISPTPLSNARYWRRAGSISSSLPARNSPRRRRIASPN